MSGLSVKLRQWTNQLFAYLYSVVFVLIGGRAVYFVQQTHGTLWPCDYVEAWWQSQGSSPTMMACSEVGRESTVVLGIAIAFGIVFALMRQLEWRLRLIACVAGLYFLLRLGYVINALGREQAMAVFGNALYVTRLEFAGLALFTLLVWWFHTIHRGRLFVAIGITAVLLGTVVFELISPSGSSVVSLWKVLALTVMTFLVCFLLGYLPAKTSRLLRVDI